MELTEVRAEVDGTTLIVSNRQEQDDQVITIDSTGFNASGNTIRTTVDELKAIVELVELLGYDIIPPAPTPFKMPNTVTIPDGSGITWTNGVPTHNAGDDLEFDRPLTAVHGFEAEPPKPFDRLYRNPQIVQRQELRPLFSAPASKG